MAVAGHGAVSTQMLSWSKTWQQAEALAATGSFLAGREPPGKSPRRRQDSDTDADTAVFWSYNASVTIGGYLAFVVGLVALTLLFERWQEHSLRSAENLGRNARGSLSLPAGTIGGTESAYRYTAYRRKPVGYLFITLWVSAWLLGQGLMAACCYSLNWHDNDRVVHSEQFLTVFLISIALSSLSRRCEWVNKACFGFYADLQDADSVVVEAAGKLHRCKVMNQGGYSSFEFLCFRFVYNEQDGQLCFAGKESFRNDVLEERLKNKGLSPGAAYQRSLLAGENEINVRVPSILASLFEEFHQMMYIYHLHCIWWYYFAGIWNTSSLWLAIVLTSGTIKALLITRWNRLSIKELAEVRLRAEVQVFRAPPD